MALTTPDNNAQTAMGAAFANAGLGSQTAAATQTAQQKTAPAGGAFNSPFGFAGVSLTPGRMAYSPLNGSMGSEAFMKMHKTLKEMIADQEANSGVNVTVLLLDRAVDPNLHFASFLFAVQSKVKPELGVGYNICLMAATGAPIPDRTETVNGENVVIPVFPEAANDEKLKQIAEQLLADRFGNVPKFSSDTCVVPADFNYEDKSAIANLAENAAAAASLSITMRAENGAYFQDFNLVQELQKRRGEQGDADLTFVYNFQPKDSVDFLKLPERASIVIQSQTGFRKNNRNQSVNSGYGPKTVSEATGYIELMPIAPRNSVFMYNQQNPNQQPITQRLAPVLVLNSVRTNFGQTPSSVLLPLLTAADLNRNHGWVSSYANKVGNRVGNIDLADVTAIAIDMPSLTEPGKSDIRPKVPAGGLSLELLMKFLGTYCRPNLYIAQDIPVASHTTWYLSLIAEAAKAPGSFAHKRLVQAFDDLLDGKFSSTLPPNTNLFAGSPLVMERSYWEVDGVRRDGAEIDYVAVCNHADATNNPMLPETWTNSFLQTQRPAASRLQDRRNIIQEITGHRAVFYGRSIRVFWNGAALNAALQCLSNAGITTSHDGRGEFAFGGERAYAQFLENAALPQGAGWATSGMVGSGGFAYGGMASTPWR